jgi:hypothetical protein
MCESDESRAERYNLARLVSYLPYCLTVQALQDIDTYLACEVKDEGALLTFRGWCGRGAQ